MKSQAITPEAGKPGAKISRPLSPFRLNFTGIALPALTTLTAGGLLTGEKKPVKFSSTVTVAVQVASPAIFSAVIVTV